MNYFQRYLVDEYAEDYQDGRLTRREALKPIASVTGSLVFANSILAACAPMDEATPVSPSGMETPVMGATQTAVPATGSTGTGSMAEGATASPETSPTASGTASSGMSIQGEDITFPAEDAELIAYRARPAEDGKYPIVLVCHENRGLTEHIKDVTRRLARAGYAALAVDLLSREGGTAALGSDQVPGALGNIPPDQFISDFQSGLRYMQEQPYVQADKVGMTGFCFGGGVTWLAATRMPELLAAVPFYGPHPPLEDVPNIRAAVLAIYGGLDNRINAGIPEIEAAMQENGKTFEKIIYPGADHAFHNDTSTRYNAQAAQDAWQKTLDWFAKYLKSA